MISNAASAPTKMATSCKLKGLRVIGLLNNTEIFGQERANVEVFKSLRRQGAEVIIGLNSLHDGGTLREYVVKLGFEVFFLPYGCHWSKKFFYSKPSLVLFNFYRVWRCSHLLSRKVHEWNPSCIHFGNPLVYSFIAPFLLFNPGVQVIYRMGDEPPSDSAPNLWIWKRAYERAERVVANSRYVKKRIRAADKQGRKSVDLIYNVAPSISSTQAKPNAPSKLRVLYVGQISEHKGVHHFVNCAIALAGLNTDWQFDIVGGSSYTKPFEDRLRAQIASAGLESQIYLHGSVADPSVFYRNALVSVVPSLFEEPAANVVLEAKRHGIPSIVYPSGGLPELVSHEKTGWICREKSAAALVQVILSCLGDPDQCRKMRNACLSEYESRFGEKRFDEQWAKIFCQGLASVDVIK